MTSCSSRLCGSRRRPTNPGPRPLEGGNADRAAAVFEAVEVDGGGGYRYESVIAAAAPASSEN